MPDTPPPPADPSDAGQPRTDWWTTALLLGALWLALSTLFLVGTGHLSQVAVLLAR